MECAIQDADSYVNCSDLAVNKFPGSLRIKVHKGGGPEEARDWMGGKIVRTRVKHEAITNYALLRLGSFQTHSLVEPWPPADPIDDRIPLLWDCAEPIAQACSLPMSDREAPWPGFKFRDRFTLCVDSLLKQTTYITDDHQ